MNTTLAGVANATNDPQTLMYDGQLMYFKPNETKVLLKQVADHAYTRIVVFQDRLPSGRLGPVQGKYIFKQVPLHEAIKVAQMDEEPSLAEAKRIAAEKDKERQELLTSLKEQLVADGWKPGARGVK